MFQIHNRRNIIFAPTIEERKRAIGKPLSGPIKGEEDGIFPLSIADLDKHFSWVCYEEINQKYVPAYNKKAAYRKYNTSIPAANGVKELDIKY